MSRGANIRAGPSTNYDIVAHAGSGDLAHVVAANARGDWFQVELADGRLGWMAGFLLDGVPDDVPVARGIPPSPTPALPTATRAPPNPPPQPSTTGRVVISRIYYDGQVYRVESDEYAEITNYDSGSVNLKGWHLWADDPGQDFWFPEHVLQPGQSCRVFTNEYHIESGGFSFGIGKAIWNNKGDCGHLFDAGGALS